jgi:hypothetical protein
VYAEIDDLEGEGDNLARIWLGFLTDNRKTANQGILWLATPIFAWIADVNE